MQPNIYIFDRFCSDPLHFHTRGIKRTISKKLNLLTSYYHNFDVEKLNKLVIGCNARHVAKELLDYIKIFSLNLKIYG